MSSRKKCGRRFFSRNPETLLPTLPLSSGTGNEIDETWQGTHVRRLLCVNYLFSRLGWFWTFGVEDANMEDDELKVYLKWTFHCIDLLYTAIHWTVSFVVQWHACMLYLFTVTCIDIWSVRSLGRIKRSSSWLRLFFDDVPEKIACSGLLLSERLEQTTEKKGMDLWKQMSSKWSFTFFAEYFDLNPYPSATTVYARSAFCTRPAFYSQFAVCILPLVRSLHSAVLILHWPQTYPTNLSQKMHYNIYCFDVMVINGLWKTISKHLIMSQLTLARQ